MERGEILLQNVQIHYLLKGKNRKIAQENEKARKKPKNPGQTGDVRPCVQIAQPSVPPPRADRGGVWLCHFIVS